MSRRDQSLAIPSLPIEGLLSDACDWRFTVSANPNAPDTECLKARCRRCGSRLFAVGGDRYCGLVVAGGGCAATSEKGRKR